MSSRRGYQFHSKGNNFKNSTNHNHQRNYKQGNQKSIQFISQERLSENEVGITEYISNLPGFSGIIKARFSDFHVSEINNDNEIAKLTDISSPKDFDYGNTAADDEDFKCPDTILEETWNQLQKMVNSEEQNIVEIDVTSVTKEVRTKIHESVKKVFGQKIVASTKTTNDKKFIEFQKYTKGCERDTRFKWPKDKGEYVYFLVYKEAMDTIEANFKISDCLRMKPSSFTYAGVKDRRAKTTQWFCVRKVDPQKLIKKTKFLRNIHIGNISFKNEPLKLGQLKGNRFTIALRNITAEDAAINEAMESLKNNGFINYYGLQRFGNDKEVPTFEIGVKLLQGDWKEACNLILKPKSSENPTSDIAQAKHTYKDTSDCNLALKKFSRNYNKCIESKLLLGFAKNHGNDCVNALENIPRNMRLLYLHSFQSLVWNKVVSQRIKEFGLKPMVGDIVLLPEQTEQLNQDNETDENDEEQATISNLAVKILAEDDLSTYTIYDVVLPLPGYDVKYPENEVKNWYKQILGQYGLTLEMPKQKVKTYTLSGAYRKILGKVDKLSWKTARYDHPNDNLIRSDYEELIGQNEPEYKAEAQYKALIVDFCLSSSCYATMVLREILKMDTSSTAQAKLNQYHEKNTSLNPKEENDQEKLQFAEANSLLSNAAKYEEFKQHIFGATTAADSLKRTADGICEESAVNKKIKSDDDNSESCIKMQPALI